MFANISRQRMIFIFALLALVLTTVISLANAGIRMVSASAFVGMPQMGAAQGAQVGGQPGAPNQNGQPGAFVPPSDFKPRDLNTAGTAPDSTQSQGGGRVPGMGPMSGFARRTGNAGLLGSLFNLGFNPRLFSWIGLAFSALFITALLFSANAVLHGDRRGINLAAGLAALSLFSSIPGVISLANIMRGGFNLAFMVTPVLSLFNLIAAAVILVLAILPSFRDDFVTVTENDR